LQILIVNVIVRAHLPSEAGYEHFSTSFVTFRKQTAVWLRLASLRTDSDRVGGGSHISCYPSTPKHHSISAYHFTFVLYVVVN
jgi:hypothetical protein